VRGGQTQTEQAVPVLNRCRYFVISRRAESRWTCLVNGAVTQFALLQGVRIWLKLRRFEGGKFLEKEFW